MRARAAIATSVVMSVVLNGDGATPSELIERLSE